jgi:hypothetical protein
VYNKFSLIVLILHLAVNLALDVVDTTLLIGFGQSPLIDVKNIFAATLCALAFVSKPYLILTDRVHTSV